MEGDILPESGLRLPPYFNPLPPYGGRQHYAALVLVSADISIHSLRMEGDKAELFHFRVFVHFNPLPPYGGRRNPAIDPSN